MDMLLDFLTGETPFHQELRTFGIAVQGAMAVRNGPNKQGKMHFFHAFALSTIVGFGGGWFCPLWLGKPTTMIAGGDVNFTLGLMAFVLVNYTPADLGYKVLKSFPFVLLTTSLAQMFRSMGTIGFISVAAKEVSPSPYYPTPVIGPILYGCLLGSMGGFFRKGFDAFLEGGIPWPFQNCLFIGTFFHLFTHDQEGPLGGNLRSAVYAIVSPDVLGDINDRTFALFVMNLFMQVTGLLKMPQFLGPSFSPFAAPFTLLQSLMSGSGAKKLPYPARKATAKKKKKKKA